MLEFLDLTQEVFETLLIKHPLLISTSDFPGGSDGKTSAYNAGDLSSIIQSSYLHFIGRETEVQRGIVSSLTSQSITTQDIPRDQAIIHII